MSNKIFRLSKTDLGVLLLIGLLGFFWQAGCKMQTQEIHKEIGTLEQIKAAGKIVVGTSSDYPPYEFHLLPELEDEMVGIDIDIAEAIAANLNIKLEIRDIVFSKLFDELAAERIDLALAGLLRALGNEPGIGRLRLGSPDPRTTDGGLVGLITSDSAICPHFHLSLQHASDDVLRKMGRRSRAADYTSLLGELKARVDTLRHVVNDRLIPSVPAQGWVDKLTVLNDDGTLKQPVQ